MIQALIMMQFHLKKRIVLHLLMLVVILSMLPLMINFGQDDWERIQYSALSIQTTSLLMPFLILFITMDHHMPAMRPMDAFFGRSFMFFSKWMVSAIVFSYVFVIIYFIQESIWTLWNGSNVPVQTLNTYLSLHAEGLILLTLCHLVLKDRHKTLSLLIPVLFIVLAMALEDIKNPIFHYLFPIGNTLFRHHRLAYPYQLCYSVLVLMVAHQKSIWENL